MSAEVATGGLAERVRRRLISEGSLPTRAAVTTAVRAEYGSPIGDRTLLSLGADLHAELVGAGPLTALLAEPDVTDVLVNGPGEVWVDRGAGLQRVHCDLGDDASIRRLAQRLAASCGRRLDDASPFVDARLPDGTRFHAALPPVAVGTVHLSLRTFRPRGFSLDELVAAGTLTPAAAAIARAVVDAHLAFLVSGGTGSGKTTLLAALLGEIAPDERLIVVEDATELRPAHPHVVSLEARPANAEGAGLIPLRTLVREALRMRADRIVVGECRGGEVVELLAALNTGHRGGAGTLHANTLDDVPARIEALGLMGGLGRDAVHAQLASAVQVAFHIVRYPSQAGGRLVTEIGVLAAGRDGRVRAWPAWRRDGGPTPGLDQLRALLESRGGAW
ncbi:TadA family conjugal transfer-associated ATPase [Cryptosporangium phraense]|uniref:TadA family conjugal transfer-associated ATPase n=1 Tax=Cryptosporangium phraense TaxID=2593070 RepID=A0A545ATC0_9ACTN|nr:TadA family conjugal transfer-associated ATPase [Cryptosporangium phraense]TQS43845.1 TadA family conjugal transfer-associated ATPase [Cryptosporangium phraense]